MLAVVCRLYLIAVNESDVTVGVQMALDNAMKVAFHGAGGLPRCCQLQQSMHDE